MLPLLSPSQCVELINQTLELTIPIVEIQGEIKNFKISKNRWVYFDIADADAKIKCFSTIYSMPGPLEDGMLVTITATPHLHMQFGFSLQVQSLVLSGEGDIKKSQELLKSQLQAEGLFAEDRKRQLPYPPAQIGLITSVESAAYTDFVKVLSARYGGIGIDLANVTVQGESVPSQIVSAIEWFNQQAKSVDVLVIIRGGGSADDLQAFSHEHVVRSVAASRIPTVVAIGHESDISLAELAADLRASTPSNAAELLVPDKKEILERVQLQMRRLPKNTDSFIEHHIEQVNERKRQVDIGLMRYLDKQENNLTSLCRTLDALSPQALLERGYSIIRLQNKVVRSKSHVQNNDCLDIQFVDGHIQAKVHI
jgi:exodeoxyribonuclease VII large subunit